ncbi:unnamed protein product [Phaeothamnion confervicola]
MLEPFGEIEGVNLGEAHTPEGTTCVLAVGPESAAAMPFGAGAAAAGLNRGGLTKARFAYVRFASSKSLKRAAKARTMDGGYTAAELNDGAAAAAAAADDNDEAAGSTSRGASSPGRTAGARDAHGDDSGDNNALLVPPEATPGLAGALRRYWADRPSRAELQEEVDSFMEEFDAAEAERRRIERQKGDVDDDGFVRVTHKKRQKLANASEGGRAGKRKKGGGELQNFYGFQMREAKREQLLQLRQKFEEDKARVARMKEARKFKPF